MPNKLNGGSEDRTIFCIVFKGRFMIFTPEEIVALFLKKLKEDADKFLGQTTTECAITVPAHFNSR